MIFRCDVDLSKLTHFPYIFLLHCRIPAHDTFLTNPPYSDDHKQRCLDVAFSQLHNQQIPFLCLMPNYVASKEYFRERVNDDVCYLVPSQSYEYNHPEGTGKQVPPFASIWFCGIGKQRMKTVEAFWNQLNMKNKPTLALNLEQLQSSGSIPTQKRGNPRQRKKRKQQATGKATCQQSVSESTTSASDNKLPPQQSSNRTNKKTKANSKYRDGTGQRKKRRF